MLSVVRRFSSLQAAAVHPNFAHRIYPLISFFSFLFLLSFFFSFFFSFLSIVRQGGVCGCGGRGCGGFSVAVGANADADVDVDLCFWKRGLWMSWPGGGFGVLAKCGGYIHGVWGWLCGGRAAYHTYNPCRPCWRREHSFFSFFLFPFSFLCERGWCLRACVLAYLCVCIYLIGGEGHRFYFASRYKLVKTMCGERQQQHQPISVRESSYAALPLAQNI